MDSLTDAALSLWGAWLAWIAVAGTAIGLLSALGGILIRNEQATRAARDGTPPHASVESSAPKVVELAPTAPAGAGPEVAHEKPEPRHFPLERRDEFVRIAGAGITQTVPVSLMFLQTDDGEPRTFAIEIGKAFGWDTSNLGSVASNDPRFRDILIFDSADVATPSKFASNLKAAFEIVGFKCVYGKDSPHPGTVCIFIGREE